MVKVTVEQNFYSPLKIGLLIVTMVFFMFTLHGILTLEWIGEWEGLSASASFWILITDLSSAIGLVFRFVGSLIAVVAVGYYFVKKGLSTQTTYKVLKLVFIAEAIYWFTFTTSGIWGITPVIDALFGAPFGIFGIIIVISTGIPCLFEAIAIPIVLFKVVLNLSPTKPQKGAIKWGLISGTCYIFVWWLNNAGVWIYTAILKGTQYLTAYPVNVISFVSTVFGLLALGIFTAYFSKKSIGTEKLESLKLKTVGAIIVVAGLYFLWNYLTGIIFGAELWSDWYAWFLGHNLDLWALSLPLLGMPLL
ncbi:MAG: hypothetical protein MUO76_04135, partial [Anaerolineaceae bacterium]|nr:hypothetical protein [Anaerolineaceae bacterium]